MYEEHGNINEEIENLEENQKEIIGLKNIITEMKNSLEWFKGRFEQEEEKNRKLENRKMKIISIKNRRKKIKVNIA